MNNDFWKGYCQAIQECKQFCEWFDCKNSEEIMHFLNARYYGHLSDAKDISKVEELVDTSSDEYGRKRNFHI